MQTVPSLYIHNADFKNPLVPTKANTLNWCFIMSQFSCAEILFCFLFLEFFPSLHHSVQLVHLCLYDELWLM